MASDRTRHRRVREAVRRRLRAWAPGDRSRTPVPRRLAARIRASARRIHGLGRLGGLGRPHGLGVVAWLLGAAALLALSTVSGSVHGVVLTTDNAPLAVAGGPTPAVLGYVGIGVTHVYVPWTVVPTLLAGELAAAVAARGRIAWALLAGVTAAGQLLVVSGCGCGTGSVASLAVRAAAGLG
ncbi:hypothetical protein [Halosimplex pelagicum]|uniref:Uncharacterized protein n=1 Tax=Halosimplex pelagicum TaxID=869886 RepID=A0A7D5TAS9_9EURY|nr:hypothetical protein [Halosimplex pelagicum]QLH81733.1 hypothetical protein HZS54_08880 [Halosimplex pelagicum]